MGAFHNPPRWRHVSRTTAIGACTILLGLPLAALAGPARTASPYALSASATLAPGATKQSGGHFSLSAALSQSPSAAPTPSGGNFTLSARLQAQPLTCESDLIFENGFDP
ncbi:MAG: hypothetical protein U1F23_01355 [Lysobacterales bacterium]